MNVRDSLYVKDHCPTIALLFDGGRPGVTSNIGGGEMLPNLAVIDATCTAVDEAFAENSRLAEKYTASSAAQGH